MSGDTRWWRWRRIVRPDADVEVNEELDFHLEQRIRDYVAAGLDANAARAAALQRLGDLGRVRSECTDLLATDIRQERRREWLKVSWLDFKLGFRMLVRYPGLTVVGGLAMAFAIWSGAGTFEFVRQILHPSLPLEGGGRIVGLVSWDASRSSPERRALYDFGVWRSELTTVQDVGAFRTLERNLVAATGGSLPVEVAEISAAAFRVARTRPLLGRTLQDSDEGAAAPAVAVIGHRLWQTRFNGDSAVVGRTVRLGSAQTTVVGVMPAGFGFPIAQQLWVPLRADLAQAAPRGGPSVRIFGRLADGATLDQAQAELAALSRRLAADYPQTHEHLRARVMPYAASIISVTTSDSVFLVSLNFLLIVLLVLICANVALLMFARAATRESELVVRNALGASRGRIVAQLFAEALVLGAVAALVGLTAAHFGLKWFFSAVEVVFFEGMRPPFWFSPGLSPATIMYALILTVVGAGVAGILPGLKVTRGLQARLREAASGLSFGGVWTIVIVAQVAVTFTFPATAFLLQRDAAQIRTADVGFPEEEYLTARLEVDRDSDPRLSDDASGAQFDARVDYLYEQLEQRLVAEPAVGEVTFGRRLPRMYHPHRLIDVDAGGAAPLHPDYPAYRVSSAHVAPDFFDALQVPLLAGRRFHAGDAAEGRAVIVNQSFVDRVLGGRNAIGRRIRYVHFEERLDMTPEELEQEPWYDIIGVVSDLLTVWGDSDPKSAAIYHAAAPHAAYPLNLAIRVNGEPSSFGPRLREVIADIDPALRVYEPMRMDELSAADMKFLAFWTRITTLISGVALVLSLAGIYAVMSFTVARRTREIGIRVALGSRPGRIVGSIFRRALIQIAGGVAMGALLVAALLYLINSGSFSLREIGMLAGYTIVMIFVCALACIVPTRRALRVQPMEAMRADA